MALQIGEIIMDREIKLARICALCSELHAEIGDDDTRQEDIEKMFFAVWEQGLEKMHAVEFHRLVVAETLKLKKA